MKKYVFFLYAILLSCSNSTLVNAQKEMITFPADGMIFQKGSDGKHRFYLSGQIETPLEILYRVEKRNSSGGWTNVLTDRNLAFTWTADGRKGFYIEVGDLPQDWYRVRLYRKYKVGFFFDKRVYKDTKTFGVGDVYFVAGQSNASGFYEPPNEYTIPYYSSTSTDEKVRVYSRQSVPFPGILEPSPMNDINQGIPYKRPDKKESFIVLRNGTSKDDLMPIYPNGRSSWCWAPLGYKIATLNNTPVLFFNSAYPNTGLKHDWTISGENTDHAKKLISTLRTYGNIHGAKAVLWQQGERDTKDFSDSNRNYPISEYSDNLNSLIDWSRKPLKDELNKKLSWYVSEVSYATGNWASNGHNVSPINPQYPAIHSGIVNKYTHSALIAEQVSVKNNNNRIYKGVVTDDNLESERDNGQRMHFSGNSLKTLADEWYTAIYNNYQNDGVSATPLVKLINVVNNGNNSYTLTVENQAGTTAYYWVRNDNGIISAPTTTSNSYKFDDVKSDDFLSCYVMKNERLSACQPFVVPGGTFDGKAINLSSENVSFIGSGETKDVGITTQNVD